MGTGWRDIEGEMGREETVQYTSTYNTEYAFRNVPGMGQILQYVGLCVDYRSSNSSTWYHRILTWYIRSRWTKNLAPLCTSVSCRQPVLLDLHLLLLLLLLL